MPSGYSLKRPETESPEMLEAQDRYHHILQLIEDGVEEVTQEDWEFFHKAKQMFDPEGD